MRGSKSTGETRPPPAAKRTTVCDSPILTRLSRTPADMPKAHALKAFATFCEEIDARRLPSIVPVEKRELVASINRWSSLYHQADGLEVTDVAVCATSA
jgi:hypothetical protein